MLGIRPSFSQTGKRDTKFQLNIVHKKPEGFAEDKGISSNTKQNPIVAEQSRNISRKNEVGIIVVDSDDFIISDSEFVPTAEEGLDQARQLQIKHSDKMNGNTIQEYKKMVRESLALLRNWQEIKKTYYIHNTRKDQLILGLDTMYSVDKKAPQKELYPKMPYPNNNSYYMNHDQAYKILDELEMEKKQFTGLNVEEFREIFGKINKFDLDEEQSAWENVKNLLQEVEVSNKTKTFLEQYLHRCLTSNLKSSANQINSKKLWAIEIEKEFNKRQHDAILASHYLKLKDYYGNMGQKILRKLKRSDNTVMNLNLIRESYNGNQTRAKKRQEWINENLYGDVGDKISQLKKFENAILEENLNTSKIVQNTRDIVNGIINQNNFEPEAFYQELVGMRQKKLMDRDYAQNEPMIFTEEMKEDFPGIEEKYNDMKAKKFHLWTFENELDKASLRQALEQSNQVYIIIL